MTAPVRWSTLRNMGRSPAHYKYFLDNPIVPTAAMRMGSLVNYRVFGVMPAGRPDPVVYEGERRGNAWKEFKEANAAREIVTEAEMDTAQDIEIALGKHPLARELLAAGAIEQRIDWTVAGRACSGTPDVLGDMWLADLKVTNDANPERFHWHARKMGWLAQLAWYVDGAIAAGLPEPGRVSIVAVEAAPPHVVTVFDLSPNALEIGRRTWRLLFERLMVCEQTDLWPGYVEGAALLDVPIEDEDLALVMPNGEEVTL